MRAVEQQVLRFSQTCQEWLAHFTSTRRNAQPVQDIIHLFSHVHQSRRIKPTLLMSIGLQVPPRENTSRLAPTTLTTNASSKTGRDRAFQRRSDATTSIEEEKGTLGGGSLDWNALAKMYPDSSQLAAQIAQAYFHSRSCDPLKFLYSISTILRIGHVLSTVDASSSLHGREDKSNSGIIAGALFSFELIKCTGHLLMQLVPSQLALLEANNLFSQAIQSCGGEEGDVRRWKSEISQRSSHLSLSEGSEVDAIPLAYSERRDSRNKAEKGLLYDNQQKIRDLFLAWIRRYMCCQGGAERNLPLMANAFEIMRSVHGDNIFWFAQVVLCEYEQLEGKGRMRGQGEEQQGDEGQEGRFNHRQTKFTCSLPQRSERNRMKKLEERFTRVLQVSPSMGENAALVFVRLVDSYRLYRALQHLLLLRIKALSDPLIDGTVRGEPRLSRDLLRLGALAVLLAVVSPSSLTSNWPDPVEEEICRLLAEANKCSHLLVVVPWVVRFLEQQQQQQASSSSLQERSSIEMHLFEVYRKMQSSHALGPQFALLLLLYPCSEASCSSSSHSSSFEQGPIEMPICGPPIDQDRCLPGLDRLLRTLCKPFSSWYDGQLPLINSGESVGMGGEGIMMPSGNLVSLPSPTTLTSTSHSTSRKVIRKVRPVRAEHPGWGSELIQRRLRQWFWWQHPNLREMVDLLIRFLSGEGRTFDNAASILAVVLPPLLPDSIRTDRDATRLTMALVLEQYEAALQATSPPI